MIDYKKVKRVKTHYYDSHADFDDGGAICGIHKPVIFSKTIKDVNCLKCLNKLNQNGDLILLNKEEHKE